MSSHLKDKQEKILQILSQIADESAKGAIIIAEGKKDVAALRDFDIEGAIITAKTGGKPLSDVLAEIENERPSEVILLFDFDQQGQELTTWFTRQLESDRISINTAFWRSLSALLGHEVQCIESLSSYINTLEEKTM